MTPHPPPKMEPVSILINYSAPESRALFSESPSFNLSYSEQYTMQNPNIFFKNKEGLKGVSASKPHPSGLQVDRHCSLHCMKNKEMGPGACLEHLTVVLRGRK